MNHLSRPIQALVRYTHHPLRIINALLTLGRPSAKPVRSLGMAVLRCCETDAMAKRANFKGNRRCLEDRRINGSADDGWSRSPAITGRDHGTLDHEGGQASFFVLDGLGSGRGPWVSVGGYLSLPPLPPPPLRDPARRKDWTMKEGKQRGHSAGPGVKVKRCSVDKLRCDSSFDVFCLGPLGSFEGSWVWSGVKCSASAHDPRSRICCGC